MSRWGIAAGPLPAGLPYADAITQAFEEADLSPLFGYAVATEESIRGEVRGWWPSAVLVISPDGGYGLFQPTPSTSGIALPANWQDPLVNARNAVKNWFLTTEQGGFPLWTAPPYTLEGDALAKCVGASYNGGVGAAELSYGEGNVDARTTGHDYGARVLANMAALAAGRAPW